MIIEALMNMIVKLLTTVLKFINIPDLSASDKASVYNFVDTILTNANSLIDLFMPYTLAKSLLLIIIAIEVAIDIYKFVMWILRKIPVAAIQ